MVVVVSSDPPSHSPAAKPPVYATLHRYGDRVCTLAIREYSWWQLGTTQVVAMPAGHRDQEHRFFPSFASAAQFVHQLLFNTRTHYNRSFEVFMHGFLHEAVLRFAVATSPVPRATAEQHAESRVACLFSAADRGRWMSVRSVLPLVPPALHGEEVRLQAGRRQQRQAGEGSSSDGHGTKRPVDEERPPSTSQPKRRKPVKILMRDGIVVWDRNLELVPPVAWVVRGHHREAQPRPDSGNNNLVLKLERVPVGPPGERRRNELEKTIGGPPPERAERHITEMAEFTELLREIWDERRPQLPAAQREETEAVVCAALVQRLKLATQLSAPEMWAQAMGDTPCPVLEPGPESGGLHVHA